MKDIVVVAPTREIFEAAERLIEKNRYDNVGAVFGSMSEGVRQAQVAVAGGARVLVTRGGTYQLCCEAVSVPVVEIKVSAYDIIQTLQSAEIRDDVIGVVGYNNVVDGFDILRELLPFEIVKIELHSEAQIEEAIAAYKERGIRTFVGDANTTRIAVALGCSGIVISSQPESIFMAIREARRIIRAIQLQKARTQRLEAITDFVHDGVVAIDAAGCVTLLNNAAAGVLRVDARAAIGRHIREVWPQCTLPAAMKRGRSELGRLETIYGQRVVSALVPIVVDGNIDGAVQTFISVSELIDMEQNVRRSLSRKGLATKYSFSDIVCRSEALRRCMENAREYAKYDSPVLILGESEVGKALFAQAIHSQSPRRRGPFVEVNCAALPPAMMESELFGHAESAQAGAKNRQGRAGLIELAHGGTLFFNEVNELPPEVQGRLLQVLQERELARLGADKVTPVDVRVICSSDKDLEALTAQGRFRRDLYYGINVLSLYIPPLRERREDIMALAAYYNGAYARKYGKTRQEIPEHIARLLTAGRYDGNVRQLQSLIERCVILGSFESVSAELQAQADDAAAYEAAPEALPDLRTMEQRYIERVCAAVDGNMTKACAILGIDRSTLWRKLRRDRGHLD